MVKLEILNTGLLSAQTVKEVLNNDLDSLGLVINGNAPIELCSVQALASALNETLKIYETLDSSSQQELGQLLRLFIFVLQRHDNKIVVPSSSASLNPVIESISDKIGVIPTELSKPELPEEQFLPKKFFTDTREKWQKMPCPNPSRTAKNQRDGKIEFIHSGNQASVRLQLKHDANKAPLSISVSRKNQFEERYLNFIDLEYYKLGLMHADHFLPAEAILRRLKEVVIAMNYDSKFKEHLSQKYSEFFSEYFIEQTTDGRQNIVGSYWYYMAPFNSMDNLWFLLASDNSGGCKQAMDPVEWLKQGDIGKEYLESLKEEEKYIDKSFSLYKISNKMLIFEAEAKSLKNSFMEFVKEKYEKQIKTLSELAKSHEETRSKVFETSKPDATTKLRSDATILAFSELLPDRLVKNITDTSSESSIESDKKQPYKKLLKAKLDQNEEYHSKIASLGDIVHSESRKAKRELRSDASSSRLEESSEIEHTASRNIRQKLNPDEKLSDTLDHESEDDEGFRYT